MNLKRVRMIGLAAPMITLALSATACGSDTETAQSGNSDAPLELALGEGDALASCMPFDVATLAGMSPAFAGTATAVEGGVVTLDIDRWYTPAAATTATLSAPTGMQALIDGFDFEVGEQYLITAAGGTVNYCGYSGPASAELTSAFEEAFNG